MNTLVLMLALVLVGCATADAQQSVSSFAELWMRVESGDRVFVTDGSGRVTTGVFAKASASTLSHLVDGQLRDLPATDVREVAKQGDSVMNGFLIGAGIGAVGLGAAFYDDCWDTIYEECRGSAGLAVLGGVLGGVVYGGVGALIDHFIKGRTVVFSVRRTGLQLRPRVTVGERGVRASMVLSTESRRSFMGIGGRQRRDGGMR